MMRSFIFYSCFLLFFYSVSFGQVSISSTTTPYTQNFNSLRSSSGTSNALPTGWRLLETGSSANSSYGVDAGSSTTGNTYSYGTGSNTERALGALQTSSLISSFGIQIRNTTGRTITSINLSYTGEQWRCGATGRGADRLDFAFSTNATSLSNGTWVNQDAFDFQSPFITTAGSRDGNAAGNRQLLSGVITGISIPNNGIIWLRWSDFNAASNDDGLAIDDLSLLLNANDVTPPVVSSLTPVNGSSNVSLNPTLSINFSETVQKGTGSITIRNTSNASIVQSIDVTSASVSVTGSSASIATTIPYSSNVYVEVAAGAFRDLAGNNFAGISGSAVWRFTTIPPPVPVLAVSPSDLIFGYTAFGSSSASQTFSFTATNILTDLALNAPNGFELSKDGVIYSASLLYTPAETQSSKTVSVRFAPPATNANYSGTISFVSGSWSDAKVNLSGNSIPPPPPPPSMDTLKVVNWNIEWFGGSLGPTDDNLQEQNVRTVMQNLNADVYALEEVVSASRLQNVVNQMPGYSMIVSDFCSNGATVSSCASAQKLAYVYKNSRVNFLRAYGVLRAGGSANAYYNWSSGRFPYLMEADVTMNNTTQRIQFVNVHAKANTSDFVVSYNRRKAGADELRDSLNVQYGNSNVILLGDFNDDLDRTITTQIAPDTTTSWISFKQDNVNFNAVTLPLSITRVPSTASYPDFIDHVTISNEMNQYYVSGSARSLKSQVEQWVASYSTTTSDHYPIETRYILTTPIVSSRFKRENKVDWTTAQISAQSIRVLINAADQTNAFLQLTDLSGRMVAKHSLSLQKGTNVVDFNAEVPVSGLYLLQINTKGQLDTRKIFINK
jgi:endonuclease/exonuclease/phosphatase family metal-dependent hydrolase